MVDRILERWLLALLGLFALAGCSGVEDTTEPPTPLEKLETVQVEPEVLWRRSVGSGAPGRLLRLEPFVAGERVFAAGRDGRVTAFAVASGKRLWERDLEMPVTAGVGGGAGLVLVAGGERELVALDAGTGETRWRHRLTSPAYAPATADRGRVAVRTQDGRINVLDAADGSEIWADSRKVPSLSLQGSATPRILAEGLLVGFDNGKLALFDLEDGRLKWEVNVAQPSGRSALERMVDVDGEPWVGDGVIYALAYQGRLVAVDAARGQLLWARELSGYHGLVGDARRIYVIDADGLVWTIDKSNGAAIWRQNGLRGRQPSAPAFHDGHLVVGDLEGYVHWIDPVSGQLVGRHRVGSEAVGGRPVAAGGRLFVLDDGGRLTALAADSGG